MVVETRDVKESLCQIRNRSVHTGGSMGHNNLLARSFNYQMASMVIVWRLYGDSVENDTFYGNFMVKLVEKLSGGFMEET